MLSDLFVGAESVLTFFFIAATLTFTYDESGDSRRQWRQVLLATLVFGLCFKPLEIYYGGYYLYLAATLLCSLLYSLLFLRRQLLVSGAMLLYLMYSVVAVKAVMINLISPENGDSGTVEEVAIRFGLYVAFFLLYLYYHLHPIQPRQRMPVRFWVLFIFSPLLLVLCIQSLTVLFDGQFTSSSSLLLFASLCAALLLSYYLCYELMQIYESQMEASFLNQKLELQLEYAQHTSSIIAQVRKERHELKNNYFYLQSLVKAGKYEALSRFLEEEMGRRLELTDEFNTGNRLVDYILTQKVNEARAEGIHVVTCAMLPPDLRARDDDLCALLMNLLDNAIEASRREEQGDIRIQIGMVKEYLSIQVKNRSSTDVLAQNPQLLTRKADAGQHGIGLKIVRQVVERYHGLFETYMESGYFVATAMLAGCAGDAPAAQTPPVFQP